MNKNLLKELTIKIKETKNKQKEKVEETISYVNRLLDQELIRKHSVKNYLNKKDVIDMIALCDLIKNNKSLNDNDLNKILKCKNRLDVIISTIRRVSPDVISDLYYLGPSRMLCKYLRILIWQEELKEGKSTITRLRFLNS
jgi:hypothetical protein